MGDVEVVIDCRTCYRLKDFGGRYYCPFAGLQPCFRGIHTTHLLEQPREYPVAPEMTEEENHPRRESISHAKEKQMIELYKMGIKPKKIAEQMGLSVTPVYRVINLAIEDGEIEPQAKIRKKLTKIPTFMPYSGRTPAKYDWERYHTSIFEKYLAGETMLNIVSALNLPVSVSTLSTYIDRYRG